MIVSIGLLSAYIAFHAKTFVYDDTYMMNNFSQMINKDGLLLTVIHEFLNMDLAYAGEMRFYGLSKAIHVLIYYFAGNRVWVYQLLMTGTHLCMSVLVYKILRFFQFEHMSVFMCICAWMFSLFANIQTFHHFTYLFLPLYFVMWYTYFNLKSYTEEKYVNAVFLFCCVFTGENTIPLLGLIIVSFIAYGIYNKNTKMVRKYIGHLIYVVGISLAWITLWKCKISKVQGGRFNNIDFGFSKLGLLKSNFVENFKSFLWLGNYKYQGLELNNISFDKVLLLMGCILVIIIVSFIYTKNKVENTENKCRFRWFCGGATIVFVGMVIIYVFLNVGMGYQMGRRYFYTIYTVCLCIGVLLINYIPSKKIKYILNIGTIVLLIGYYVFWNGMLLPVYAQRDEELLAVIRENPANTLVVVTENNNPSAGSVYEEGIYSCPKSAFSAGWTTVAYLDSTYDNIIIIPKNTELKYNDGNITLEAEMILQNAGLVQNSKVQVAESETCFMYMDYKGDYVITAFENFYISHYSNIWSSNEKYIDNTELLFANSILDIDAGNEALIESGFAVSVIGGNPAQVDSDNEYFEWNRNSSGTGVFSYEIGNVEQIDDLLIYMDFKDFWSQNPNDRIFDIEISYDDHVFKLENFDIFSLGGNQEVRLVTEVPEGTEKIKITFCGKENSDVAMVQRIGLISNNK